jgi:hypothetical protein
VNSGIVVALRVAATPERAFAVFTGRRDRRVGWHLGAGSADA